MKRFLLFLLLTVGVYAQNPPVTVTPTLVSIQLGPPLYCAINWLKATVQIQAYCYITTGTGGVWNFLIFNSIFYANNQVTLPTIILCVPGSHPCVPDSGHEVTWQISPGTVSGTVNWAVAWNSVYQQNGTFQ